MTLSGYTEDALVEQPAIEIFKEQGWVSVAAKEEVPRGTLGRETKSEVVLVSILRTVVEKLNPQLPSEAFASAVEGVVRDHSAMSLAAATREIWELLQLCARDLVVGCDGEVLKPAGRRR